MWLQIFYEWAAARAKPKPTLQEELVQEARRLHRDTIVRKLCLIDDEYKIRANQAKAEYLLEQIFK